MEVTLPHIMKPYLTSTNKCMIETKNYIQGIQ